MADLALEDSISGEVRLYDINFEAALSKQKRKILEMKGIIV